MGKTANRNGVFVGDAFADFEKKQKRATGLIECSR